MKILILSCNTGGGHTSAACAVQEVLKEHGVETELFDPIQLKSEKAKNIVSDVYNKIIKSVPKVFGIIYKAGSLYDATPLPSPVYYANGAYAKELKEYILENKFDCVICSHLYAMEAMTYAREKLDLKIPCYGILTDYTCIPFTADTKLDGYFIPHESLISDAVKKGLPEDKLYPYGIPVNPKFKRKLPKAQAREELGLPQDKKIILLMFGSVGCKKTLLLCNKLFKGLDENYVVYVITGNNETLHTTLQEKYAASGRIVPLGYTEQANLYMNAADVFISKAGGLSSTEAAVAGVPLVHFKTIPGCETKNAKFFSLYGMSWPTKKMSEAVKFAKELACNEKKAALMTERQQYTVNPDAAQDIVRTILDKITVRE